MEIPKRSEVHNYSVGSYEGRDHLSIYLWKFQGDGAYTGKPSMEKREFPGSTLTMELAIHTALDGWHQFCSFTACLNKNCKNVFYFCLPILNFRRWGVRKPTLFLITIHNKVRNTSQLSCIRKCRRTPLELNELLCSLKLAAELQFFLEVVCKSYHVRSKQDFL